MATTEASSPAAPPPVPSTGRDTAVDFVKAACLIVVVGLHAMMAGFTVGPEGLTITNALDGHPNFAWSTWAVQVMPLFFLLGGFSSLTQWRRLRAAGVSASDYVRMRITRLVRPAVLLFALVGLTLAILALTGLPADILREVGFRIGQPLWFLAVYIGCAGLVPGMTALHERAPRLTLGALLLAAVTVDSVVAATGLELLGALNLFFVWVLIQQLGFAYADGIIGVLPRWALFLLAVAAFALLLFLTTVFGYSTDMYENLNPPTVCILVLGVGQLMLFATAHPWLRALADKPRVARVGLWVNANSMTIYLWHVPVIVLVVVVMLISNLPFPEPLSLQWWQTRQLFLVAIAVALVPIVMLVRQFDRSRHDDREVTMSPLLAATKVLLGVAGVTVILLVGFSPAAGAALGVLLLALAVQLRGRRRRVPEPVGEAGGAPEPAAAHPPAPAPSIAPRDDPAAPSQKP
ncbi:acyltransferase [Chryseoglobus sp. 28M-23]|uniref:acyltransferase family protein n=1 Tax=Chryseoglobus sp. 28M-23 TaxID=2772253 RepID=UPI001747AC1D|nr:acyltransferase [Chryseoglobus sp. 28M-23]QOD93594.1 acyltransferase [Chryseoglobus sp. 28M-23]